MSVFEEKIKRERNFFDSKEPRSGHRDRFLGKLEGLPSSTKNTQRFSMWMKLAAAVVVLISVGLGSFYFLNDTAQKNQLVNTLEYSSDLSQVLAYYDAASKTKFESIDQLVANSSEADKLKTMAKGQMDEIDISLANIEKEYSKNPENENVKAALINNKRKKVEVMDRIILQIDFANSGIY